MALDVAGLQGQRAFEEIRRYSGRQFDPRCAEAFLAIPVADIEALRVPRVASARSA